MSKPIFEDLFNFSGRRNRQSYIVLHLIYTASMLLAIGLSTAMSVAIPPVGGFLWIVTVVIGIAMGVSLWAATSQRIRDFGQSGVWALALLIPYVGFAFSIALWLIPSSQGDNKYGPSCI